MAVHRDLLAGAVRDLDLWRPVAYEVCAEEPQQIDELAVFEFGKRGQWTETLESNQLDAAILSLAQFVEQIRISLEEFSQILLRFLFGRALRCGADLRGERDPTLVARALGSDR